MKCPRPSSRRGGRQPQHVDTLDSGPVMIINNFQVQHDDLGRFVDVMNELRLVRLRTGAYRWRLYRDASDPGRLSEVFLTVSWQEHLNQHRRIDDASASSDPARPGASTSGANRPAVISWPSISSARPTSSLLVGMHSDLHQTDGSIQLEEVTELGRGRAATRSRLWGPAALDASARRRQIPLPAPAEPGAAPAVPVPARLLRRRLVPPGSDARVGQRVERLGRADRGSARGQYSSRLSSPRRSEASWRIGSIGAGS